VSDPDSNVYIANIFCSRSSGYNVYSNMSHSDPMKRMCVRDQINTLISASLEDREDNLTSIESRLVVGLDVDSD
jgi:hypothetical protein